MYEAPNLQVLSTIIYFFLIFASVIISVMGSMIILTILTRSDIEVKEEILRNRNIGLALVLGSFIWTIGRMCIESIKPIMNAWYNSYASGFSLKTGLLFMAGIFGSLLNALLVGGITVYLALKALMVLNRDINQWLEIKRGNVAVAIVFAITVIVAGMFFESIISYIVMNIFDFAV